MLPVRAWMDAALGWVEGLGLWAPAVFLAAYVVVAVFSLPGSVLTIAVGAALGPVWGMATASAGATLGATAAFLVGRFLARRWVAPKIASRPRFTALDQAVRREGFKIILLSRLSPIIPFALLNYGYGLTNVPLGTYVLASWIGMIPGTILYVYLGTLGRAATTWSDMGFGRRALYVTGLLATAAVTVMITVIARRTLGRSVDPDAPPDDPSAGA
ncbi:MAG: TVP38/TMEM64 family protein [Planctomycetes bacterium]|nr:TVP38/TMEM64 family protein [Planctomycetota bacterium]